MDLLWVYPAMSSSGPLVCRKRRLQCVVRRITDRDVVPVTGEVGAQRAASRVDYSSIQPCIDAVFSVRPADRAAGLHLAFLADAEAQRRIASVRFQVTEQVVTYRADVRYAGDGVLPELPLQRQIPALRDGVWFSCQKPGELEIGRNCDQSMVLSGCCGEAFAEGKWGGKRWPSLNPVSLSMKGVANNGGAGDAHQNP